MFGKPYKRSTKESDRPAFLSTAPDFLPTAPDLLRPAPGTPAFLENRDRLSHPSQAKITRQTDETLLDENPHFNTIDRAFPRIAKRLKLSWGEQELTDYVRHLLTDTRDGTRQGFPFEVVDALQNLSDQHDQTHPHIAGKDKPWAQVKKR